MCFERGFLTQTCALRFHSSPFFFDDLRNEIASKRKKKMASHPDNNKCVLYSISTQSSSSLPTEIFFKLAVIVIASSIYMYGINALL